MERKGTSIVLIFDAEKASKQVNVGDTVIVRYSEFLERYVAIYGEHYVADRIGVQSLNSSAAGDLLVYVAEKTNAQMAVWDDEFSLSLDNTIGEVVAIDNQNIIVKPRNQKEIWDELDGNTRTAEEEMKDEISEFLNGLIDTLSSDNTEAVEKTEEKTKEKEETDMFQSLNASFGKINSNQFRLSINGLAVRGNDGKYYTFNPETKELVEVSTGFFDDMKDLLFLMPTTELEVGDVILHQDKPYFITSVKEGNIKGIDFEGAIENVLIPKTNVFGMKYYTKVFNCLGTNNILGSDIASNPMMAYALMGGKDFDLSKVMMFQAMSGQGKGIADFSENPIMLMALMNNENGQGLSDFAKLQVLSQLAAKKKPAKETKKEN